MRIHAFEQEQWLPAARDDVWAFFARPANLEAITPPEMGFETVGGDGGTISEGHVISHRVRVAPGIRVNWESVISGVVEGVEFVDEQRRGPFRYWRHRHGFRDADGGTLVIDSLRYALPLGFLGAIAHRCFVRRKIETSMRYRQERLAEIFRRT